MNATYLTYRTFCLAFVLSLLTTLAQAQDWTIEIHTGTSFKAPSSITVNQEGYPVTTIDGVRYETKAWINAKSIAGLTENYYSVRVGYYPEDAKPDTWGVGYELELLHDKAYYIDGTGNDPDDVIQHFELSDGLNMGLVNLVGRYPLLPSEHHPMVNSTYCCAVAWDLLSRHRPQIFAGSRVAHAPTKAPTLITGSLVWVYKPAHKCASFLFRNSH
jgi:hypothetical protein